MSCGTCTRVSPQQPCTLWFCHSQKKKTQAVGLQCGTLFLPKIASVSPVAASLDDALEVATTSLGEDHPVTKAIRETSLARQSSLPEIPVRNDKASALRHTKQIMPALPDVHQVCLSCGPQPSLLCQRNPDPLCRVTEQGPLSGCDIPSSRTAPVPCLSVIPWEWEAVVQRALHASSIHDVQWA